MEHSSTKQRIEQRTEQQQRQFFPSVDRWFEQFLGPPERAKKIYLFFGFLGLVVASAYGGSVHASTLVPYAVVGVLAGLVFLPLLRIAVKTVLGIVVAACALAVVALIIYAVSYFLH